MYSNYGINSNSKMTLKRITKLIIDANKKDLESKLWQQWLVEFGRMDNTNFVSFEKYKSESFKVEDNAKYDKEEILKKAEIIKNAHQKVKVTEPEV